MNAMFRSVQKIVATTIHHWGEGGWVNIQEILFARY